MLSAMYSNIPILVHFCEKDEPELEKTLAGLQDEERVATRRGGKRICQEKRETKNVTILDVEWKIVRHYFRDKHIRSIALS